MFLWLDHNDDEISDVWCAEIEWLRAVATVDRSPFGPFGGDHVKLMYTASVDA